MIRNFKLLEGWVSDAPFSVKVFIGAFRVVLLHCWFTVLCHQFLVQFHCLLETFEKVLFLFTRLLDLFQLLGFAGLQKLLLNLFLLLEGFILRAFGDRSFKIYDSFLDAFDSFEKIRVHLAKLDLSFALISVPFHLFGQRIYRLVGQHNHFIKMLRLLCSTTILAGYRIFNKPIELINLRNYTRISKTRKSSNIWRFCWLWTDWCSVKITYNTWVFLSIVCLFDIRLDGSKFRPILLRHTPLWHWESRASSSLLLRCSSFAPCSSLVHWFRVLLWG